MKIFDRSIMPENLTFAFIRGIIAIGLLYLIIHFDLNIHNYADKWFEEGSNIWGAFGVLAFAVEIYVFLHLGFFAIQSVAVALPFFGLSGGSQKPGSLDNVDRMIEYRNSAMNNMNNDDAANLLRDTAWMDSLKAGTYGGSRTKEVGNYINSQLSNMSNDKALTWLRNRSK